MKIELTQTQLLSTSQIGELASNLDAIHSRTLKVIERLNKDVAARKAEIAIRWKNTISLSASDLARIAQNETVAAIGQIKDNSRTELDGLLRSAAPAHTQLNEQRPLYDSPVKVLSRTALGDPKRTEYLQQLQFAGHAEMGHMAQVAVSTKNVPLAAAVLSLVDCMPTKERPVSPVELASAMRLDDYVKVQEYLKLGDARLQGIVIAIRAWNAGRANPLNTVALAMYERDINHDLIAGDDNG